MGKPKQSAKTYRKWWKAARAAYAAESVEHIATQQRAYTEARNAQILIRAILDSRCSQCKAQDTIERGHARGSINPNATGEVRV